MFIFTDLQWAVAAIVILGILLYFIPYKWMEAIGWGLGAILGLIPLILLILVVGGFFALMIWCWVGWLFR